MRLNLSTKQTNIVAYDPFYDEWGYIDPSPEREESMKVTQMIRDELFKAAKREFQDAEAEVIRLENLLRTADKIRDEKRATLSWVEALVVGSELTAPAKVDNTLTRVGSIYHIPSRSGLTKGHYIEKFANGIMTCSCPSFMNRSYCWATKELKEGKHTNRLWLGTRNSWQQLKEQAVLFGRR